MAARPARQPEHLVGSPGRRRERDRERPVRPRRTGFESGRAAATPRSRTAERRRRERHFRRRRRDLVEDLGLGLLLAIVIISVTAGLGVVAMLEIPLGAAVIGSIVAERVRRRRRPRPARRRR
jgi:hypothetical protein